MKKFAAYFRFVAAVFITCYVNESLLLWISDVLLRTDRLIVGV
jgi:hypothetical protein